MSGDGSLSRKTFVALGASVAAAATARDPVMAEAAPKATTKHAVPMHMAAPTRPLGVRPEAYLFFTAPEAAFMEAAVERIIPTDAHGPGAKAAGVAYFIDQQLAGRYGRGDTMFTQGPWQSGLPTQGYQSRLTPADVYRSGIAETNAYAVKTFGRAFNALSATHQDTILSDLEHATPTFATVGPATFFNFLLGDSVQGFFADPMYGGNRDKVGWKTVGFPGVGAVYYAAIDKQNVPYVVEPVGIADEMQHSMALHDGAPTPHEQTRLAARNASKDLA